MTGWRFVTSSAGAEERVVIGGLKVWSETWRDTGQRVVLPDPMYAGHTHSLDIYEIGPADARVTFAAGEFSNGIWGFYEAFDA